jgi:hypothetical protein
MQEVAVVHRPKERRHLRVLANDLFQDELAQLRFTEPPRMLFVTLAWLVT